MTTKPAAVFVLLALSLAAQSACAPPTRPTAPATGVRASSPEVVPVAPPTGEREADRASILAATGHPDSLPRARPNEHRATTGRVVDGELRVELEAVEAAWYPRGPDGPRIVTPSFAERGRAPQVPGPLIRASAGTPVRVSLRNALGRAITVLGLVDRATMELPEELRDDAEAGDPRFFFADSLVVPPGEIREIRFTPTAEVSSFYYGRRAAPEGGFVNRGSLPGNFGDEGGFLGALEVDPADVSRPPDERVLLISRWGGREEPSTLAVTFKMMINGLSWPFTERLRYTVGDTVRWRVINTSVIEHPMHLHLFRAGDRLWLHVEDGPPFVALRLHADTARLVMPAQPPKLVFERDGSGTVVGLREIVEGEPRERAARTPPYQPDLAELRAYEGSYRSDELRSTWTLTAEPGRLVGHHERRGRIMNLTPTGLDRFCGNGWAYRQVEFVRDERGRVVAVLFSSERFRDERFERVETGREFPR